MARVAGRELDGKWRVEYALTKIKGIGWQTAGVIVDSLKMPLKTRVSELAPEQISNLSKAVDKYVHEGDLIREVKSSIVRLQQTNSYRGVRHSRGLPTRGQRTKTNARTKRGKRKTVGAFKKETLAKMQAAQK